MTGVHEDGAPDWLRGSHDDGGIFVLREWLRFPWQSNRSFAGRTSVEAAIVLHSSCAMDSASLSSFKYSNRCGGSLIRWLVGEGIDPISSPDNRQVGSANPSSVRLRWKDRNSEGGSASNASIHSWAALDEWTRGRAHRAGCIVDWAKGMQKDARW